MSDDVLPLAIIHVAQGEEPSFDRVVGGKQRKIQLSSLVRRSGRLTNSESIVILEKADSRAATKNLESSSLF